MKPSPILRLWFPISHFLFPIFYFSFSIFHSQVVVNYQTYHVTTYRVPCTVYCDLRTVLPYPSPFFPLDPHTALIGVPPNKVPPNEDHWRREVLVLAELHDISRHRYICRSCIPAYEQHRCAIPRQCPPRGVQQHRCAVSRCFFFGIVEQHKRSIQSLVQW